MPRPASVVDFRETLSDDRKITFDAVDAVMADKYPHLEPVSVNPKFLGYGSYHYKYASGHEGDDSLVTVANQKAHFAVYLCADQDGQYLVEANADRLGAKVSCGKGCIRVKKSEHVDHDVLEELIDKTVASISDKYDVK